jgi:hypothetical protein
MADRQVTRSDKDSDGDITALCNPKEWWSPRPKRDAIHDIEQRTHTYFVQQPGTRRADIHVVTVGGRKHLRTDPDASRENNLDNLPDC